MVLVAGGEDVEDVKKDNEKDGLGRSGCHFFCLVPFRNKLVCDFVWGSLFIVQSLYHPLQRTVFIKKKYFKLRFDLN